MSIAVNKEEAKRLATERFKQQAQLLEERREERLKQQKVERQAVQLSAAPFVPTASTVNAPSTDDGSPVPSREQAMKTFEEQRKKLELAAVEHKKRQDDVQVPVQESKSALALFQEKSRQLEKRQLEVRTVNSHETIGSDSIDAELSKGKREAQVLEAREVFLQKKALLETQKFLAEAKQTLALKQAKESAAALEGQKREVEKAVAAAEAEAEAQAAAVRKARADAIKRAKAKKVAKKRANKKRNKKKKSGGGQSTVKPHSNAGGVVPNELWVDPEMANTKQKQNNHDYNKAQNNKRPEKKEVTDKQLAAKRAKNRARDKARKKRRQQQQQILKEST